MNAEKNRSEIIKTIPAVIAADSKTAAIALAASRRLNEMYAATETSNFYANIDLLSEDILDTMARDMNLSWWDIGYNIDIKRKLMKQAGAIQKREGTEWAVETVVKAVFGNSAEVRYWYDDKTIPTNRFVVILENAARVSDSQIKKAVSRVKRATMIFDGTAQRVEVRAGQACEMAEVTVKIISGVAVWNGEYNFDATIAFDSEAAYG